MTLLSILQYVKTTSQLEHRYILIELYSKMHTEKTSKPVLENNQDERFDMHGRFGRKARHMSGMAASLLQARTFQDTQNRKPA